MNKLLIFFTKITKSFTASLNFTGNIVGIWPSVLVGYLMIVGIIDYKKEGIVLELLSFLLITSAILTLASVVAYGGFQKIGIKPWWKWLTYLTDITIDGKIVFTQDEYIEKIYTQKVLKQNKKNKEKSEHEISQLTEKEKKSIYKKALDNALFSATNYPFKHTLNAMWAAFLITIPFYFYEAYLMGGFFHNYSLLPVLGIGIAFFYAFIYVTADIMTANIRHELKKIIKPNNNYSRSSLILKFVFQILITILSLISLFILMSTDNIPLHKTLTFIIVLSIVTIYLTYLYIKSIMISLKEIATAIKNLGEGGEGRLYLASIDKEFVELGNDFSKSAKEVIEFRSSLEQKVEEKTQALQFANEGLQAQADIMEMELNLAKDIQEGLLPIRKEWKALKFANFYWPMEKVSGDYYDIFELPNGKLGVVMADVSGHGVPAALITTMGKISFAMNSQKVQKTDKILQLVNRDLGEHVKTQDYMTAFLIIFDPSFEFSYTNAAHQKAIHFNEKNEIIEELDTNGFFLGTGMEPEEVAYEEKTSYLAPGEKLLLFTDGIVEMQNTAKEDFGEKRLADFFLANVGLDIQALNEKFAKHFKEFIKGAKVTDDISFFLIERDKNISETKISKENLQIIKEKLYQTQTLFKQNKIKEGFELLEELHKTYPGEPQIIYPLAKGKLRNKNTSEARKLLASIHVPLKFIKNNDLKNKIQDLKKEIGL